MDIHGYIHRNSMDMDMDRIFHLHGKPDKYATLPDIHTLEVSITGKFHQQTVKSLVFLARQISSNSLINISTRSRTK